MKYRGTSQVQMCLWHEPLNGKRHQHLGMSRLLDFTSNSDFFIVQLVAPGSPCCPRHLCDVELHDERTLAPTSPAVVGSVACRQILHQTEVFGDTGVLPRHVCGVLGRVSFNITRGNLHHVEKKTYNHDDLWHPPTPKPAQTARSVLLLKPGRCAVYLRKTHFRPYVLKRCPRLALFALLIANRRPRFGLCLKTHQRRCVAPVERQLHDVRSS